MESGQEKKIIKWNSTDLNYLRVGLFYSEDHKGALYYRYWEN